MRGAALRALGLALETCRRGRDADGLAGMFAHWEFWAFAVAGILAFLVQQVSLATGRLAPSVAMTSVLNPLVGILVGTVLLDERLADPTWHKLVAYSGLGLALVAAVSITRATEEAKTADAVEVVPRRWRRPRRRRALPELQQEADRIEDQHPGQHQHRVDLHPRLTLREALLGPVS